MQKKSLSRLGLIVFLTFSNITACSITLPSIQTSNDKKTDAVTQSNSTSSATQNNSNLNNAISGQDNNGNLTNKASDADPVTGNTTTVVSSPVPTLSPSVSTPTPSPTASSASVTGQGGGQLNVLINPNMPTKRTSP